MSRRIRVLRLLTTPAYPAPLEARTGDLFSEFGGEMGKVESRFFREVELFF